MAANNRSGYTATRSYRLTPYQAFELDKTARLLDTSESDLVRTLLNDGLKKIWEQNIG